MLCVVKYQFLIDLAFGPDLEDTHCWVMFKKQKVAPHRDLRVASSGIKVKGGERGRDIQRIILLLMLRGNLP